MNPAASPELKHEHFIPKELEHPFFGRKGEKRLRTASPLGFARSHHKESSDASPTERAQRNPCGGRSEGFHSPQAAARLCLLTTQLATAGTAEFFWPTRPGSCAASGLRQAGRGLDRRGKKVQHAAAGALELSPARVRVQKSKEGAGKSPPSRLGLSPPPRPSVQRAQREEEQPQKLVPPRHQPALKPGAALGKPHRLGAVRGTEFITFRKQTSNVGVP